MLQVKGPFLPWLIIGSYPLALVQIQSQYSVFDKLLAAYAEIGEALPRFDRHETIFQQPDFRHVLALVYADILEFHRSAYKILKRRGPSCLPQVVCVRLILPKLGSYSFPRCGLISDRAFKVSLRT